MITLEFVKQKVSLINGLSMQAYRRIRKKERKALTRRHVEDIGSTVGIQSYSEGVRDNARLLVLGTGFVRLIAALGLT